jgi:hypothetical protein
MLLRPTGGAPVTIRPRIPEKRGNHLDADMAAKRPTENDCLGHAQFSEQLDGGVRKAGMRVALRGIGRVAGLAVAR